MTQEYAYADYIMTLSSFSRQSFLKRGFPECKILQVPCGFDVEDFVRARQNSALQPQKFRVIFVGLICLRKGIHHLLEAWNKLNLPENEAELVLVGNLQKDFKQVLRHMSLKKNVIFSGPVNREKLAKLYQTSSVFVLPSVEDGFGMVMGEAMASGLPVICTDCTGGPDILQEQKHGFIVPSKNIEILAERILWCFQNQNLAKQMGMEAQQYVQQFTWDNYGEKVYEVYQKILGKKVE
jgi:glycosyltransferase involved in cell wall biosynthesis